MRRPVCSDQYAARAPADLRLIPVQPDREHAFVDVIWDFGHEGLGELQQRVEALLIAGVRSVLLDPREARRAAVGTAACARAGEPR